MTWGGSYRRSSYLTWAKCVGMFTGRNANKERRPLANNTHLYRMKPDGSSAGQWHYAVKLYNTFILRIYANNCHHVSAGGWQTVTTKARLNKYSPARVYSAKGSWWVRTKDDVPIVFEDGMMFNSVGEFIDGGLWDSEFYREAYRRIMEKRPRGYATWGLIEEKTHQLGKKLLEGDTALAR